MDRPQRQGSAIERLYLLDVVRGCGALSVVVWHYQHFFYIEPSKLAPGFERASQPFYPLFWLLYEHGGRAVQMFFVLSGFVFFYGYRESIRARAVGARRFFVLRFSRLYPLHIATLLLVAAGQLVSRAIDGQFIVYPCNTAQNFALNVFFVMHWLPADQICWSFNAPSWSVSVEVFLYAVFFIIALHLPRSWRGQVGVTAAMVTAGAIIYQFRGFHLIGEPLFCFFSGGLACLIWDGLRSQPVRLIIGALGAIAGAGLYFFSRGVSEIVLGVVLYPAVALLLATIQDLHPKAGYRGRWVGDISYSTYLTHFPIQLGLLLLNKSGVTHLDFGTPQVWFAFFGILLTLSMMTYRYFEMPLQSSLRRRLIGKRSVSRSRPPDRIRSSELA
jgi:peptidoglycan/LPS O-acetylase OafA/YrhL